MYQLQRLPVSMGFKRLACGSKSQLEDAPDFRHQAVLKHPRTSRIQPLIEFFALRKQAELQGSIALKRVAAFANPSLTGRRVSRRISSARMTLGTSFE